MILVTGATGLVGSHLLFELTKREQLVRASFRAHSGVDRVKKLFSIYDKQVGLSLFERIQWTQCNLTDYQETLELTSGIKTVFHCAAMVSFSSRKAQSMVFNNVQGTANMVDASLANGVEAFCHVSSIAALGDAVNGSTVDESCSMGKLKKKSAYARSKFFSENEVWRGIEYGLNAVIVNPSVIIGPTSWNSGSGLLFSTIGKGFPFYTTGVSGYVGVTDVVQAMLLLVENKKWGQRYLLNSENISHQQVFSQIAVELGKKKPTIRVRKWMSSLAWPIAYIMSLVTGKDPVITRETAKSGHSKTYYSAQKIENELGFKSNPISQAIKDTAKIYKEGSLQ